MHLFLWIKCVDWIFAESIPYQFCLVRYSNENKRRFLLNASYLLNAPSVYTSFTVIIIGTIKVDFQSVLRRLSPNCL